MVSIDVVHGPPIQVSTASRDSLLTLRRVERQQHLVAMLVRSRSRRTLQELADRMGVTTRTIARDLERLRHSGIPIDVVPGRGGGVELAATTEPAPVTLDVAEIAALIASLAAVGPTVSESAQSAMTKLVTALADARVDADYA